MIINTPHHSLVMTSELEKSRLDENEFCFWQDFKLPKKLKEKKAVVSNDSSIATASQVRTRTLSLGNASTATRIE